MVSTTRACAVATMIAAIQVNFLSVRVSLVLQTGYAEREGVTSSLQWREKSTTWESTGEFCTPQTLNLQGEMLSDRAWEVKRGYEGESTGSAC